MTHTLRSLFAVSALVALPAFQLMAQCPGCVADLTCTATPAYPTLCPAQPPDAVAGEYYESDITFWLPTQFTDPGTGFNVTFNQMTITSVSGLPFGLSLETSSPSNVFFPQQNQYGCARICGVPVGPGNFEMTISIIAGVTFSGISIDAPQQFVVPLVVQPGSGANSSFAFSPSSGCGSVEVAFEALIDASPAPMSYAWDFGNGTTSTAQDPVVTYDGPGTYSVQLETTILGYVLNSLSVSGVGNNWCGDVEEAFCNCGTPIIGTCPDLYFVLSNAAGAVFTSNTVDGVTSATWNNLNILLSDPPYTISVWDEDVVSANDNLGSFSIIPGSSGPVAFSVSGTNGTLDIQLVPQQTFVDTDEVTVFPLPEVVIAENTSTGELCTANADLISFTWFLDGDTVAGAFGPCLTPAGPGQYWVVASDGFGCSAQSNVWVVCPQVTITRTGPQLSAPAGFAGYAWSLNGTPIPGANGPTIQAGADGVYSVTVQAENDCEVTASFTYSTVGIEDLEASGVGMVAYPVPNDGTFTVEALGLTGNTVVLRVVDLGGRMVREERHPVSAGRLRVAMLLDVAAGSYTVQLVDDVRSFTQRIVVR